jgi:hypothetical protein
MSRVVRWVSRGTVKTGRHGEDRLRVHRAISNRDEIERPTLSRLRDGKSVDVKLMPVRGSEARSLPRPSESQGESRLGLTFGTFDA